MLLVVKYGRSLVIPEVVRLRDDGSPVTLNRTALPGSIENIADEAEARLLIERGFCTAADEDDDGTPSPSPRVGGPTINTADPQVIDASPPRAAA